MGFIAASKGRLTAPVVGLAALFAAIYFSQGITEPTEGLITQPVRSMLKNAGRSSNYVGWFQFAMSVPWMLKPLYGLLTDFVPIRGSRRRTYLLLSALLAGLPLAWLAASPAAVAKESGAAHLWLLIALVVPTLGVAFADVVVDALMVEAGQARGLTGTLQSVQWTAMYSAGALAGAAGGWIAEHRVQWLGFATCAAACLGTFCLAWLFVREQPSTEKPRFDSTWQAILATLRLRTVWGAALFLWLWNFNPFGTNVLNEYMTEQLELSEQFYGHTVAIVAIASAVASGLYGCYCRLVPFRILVHGSIVTGILATLAYWYLVDERSAIWISVVVGVTYMTATLIQLDLAARVCPPETAGTTFALLMAISNLSYSLSASLGGSIYQSVAMQLDETRAFQCLVGLGAASTACCWLVVPLLTGYVAAKPDEAIANGGQHVDQQSP